MTGRYSDPIDQAAASTEAALERSIKAVLGRTIATRPFTGLCYYCEATIARPKSFCGPACADEYEKERR